MPLKFSGLSKYVLLSYVWLSQWNQKTSDKSTICQNWVQVFDYRKCLKITSILCLHVCIVTFQTIPNDKAADLNWQSFPIKPRCSLNKMGPKYLVKPNLDFYRFRITQEIFATLIGIHKYFGPIVFKLHRALMGKLCRFKSAASSFGIVWKVTIHTCKQRLKVIFKWNS